MGLPNFYSRLSIQSDLQSNLVLRIKALVTGATGFIGRRLAERLIAEGWDVRLFVRDPSRLAASLRAVDDVAVGDLLDQMAVARAVEDVDVVFHCAANVKTWDTWESYYRVNVSGVKVLMEAIADVNPELSRLVHLSSVDVYGFPAFPCDENCKITGIGFGYGESKLLGESLAREHGDRNGISYTIIRPANVIGPGSQFITRIGRELSSGIMLKVNGGRSNAGLVYIDNLVDRLIWAATSADAHRECFNVRDECDVNWATFLDKFSSAIGGRGIVISLPFFAAETVGRILETFNLIFMPAREPILHRLIVRFFGRTCGHSAEKIRQMSKLKDRIGFDEAMEKSCRWFLENESAGF